MSWKEIAVSVVMNLLLWSLFFVYLAAEFLLSIPRWLVTLLFRLRAS